MLIRARTKTRGAGARHCFPRAQPHRLDLFRRRCQCVEMSAPATKATLIFSEKGRPSSLNKTLIFSPPAPVAILNVRHTLAWRRCLSWWQEFVFVIRGQSNICWHSENTNKLCDVFCACLELNSSHTPCFSHKDKLHTLFLKNIHSQPMRTNSWAELTD